MNQQLGTGLSDAMVGTRLDATNETSFRRKGRSIEQPGPAGQSVELGVERSRL